MRIEPATEGDCTAVVSHFKWATWIWTTCFEDSWRSNYSSIMRRPWTARNECNMLVWWIKGENVNFVILENAWKYEMEGGVCQFIALFVCGDKTIDILHLLLAMWNANVCINIEKSQSGKMCMRKMSFLYDLLPVHVFFLLILLSWIYGHFLVACSFSD